MRQSLVNLTPQFQTPLPQFEAWLLRQVFQSIGPAPIRLAYRDYLAPCAQPPIATITIHDLPTLLHLILDPEIAFGEAFSEGRIDVDGDLLGALTAVYESWTSGRACRSWRHHLSSVLTTWRQANTLHGSSDNIHRHYDLGNEFYKLWLDSQLVYTCAYFPTPSATLEQAQEAKLDHVCRKLRLRPGEHVVEAGCGWGALALHMARHYGVHVRAFNISREQILFARQRTLEEGLSARVQFIHDDCRNITGFYDAFVSVGMLEHIGLSDYHSLGEVIHRSIGDTGRGLLHFIGRSYKGDFSRWIRKRIFPGAYAPTLAEAAHILEPSRYAITDVENLRLHYAKTLEHWLQRFNDTAPQIAGLYSPFFERAWRLYLAGSIAAFRAGTLQLFQITFAGSKCQNMPWTRAAMYAHTPVRENSLWTPVMS